MAVERTGSVYTFTSASSPQEVTVPTDANLAVVHYGYYTLTYASFSLGGSALTEVIKRSSGDSMGGLLSYIVSPPTGSQSFAWSLTSGRDGPVVTLAFYKNVDTTDPIKDFDYAADGSGSNQTVTTPNMTCSAGDMVFLGLTTWETAPDVSGGSQTVIRDAVNYNQAQTEVAQKSISSGSTTTATGYGDYPCLVAVTLRMAAAGVIQLTVTDGFGMAETVTRISTFRNTITDGFSGAETLARILTAIESTSDGVKASDAAITAYLIQHSFRFRNDDDSEAAATWKAALNTAISLAAGNTFRLRYLINAINDPASKQFQVEYRRKPSGGEFGPWKQIN